jgi:hypothetical protein
MNDSMHYYILHWNIKGSKPEPCKGITISDAFTHAGYGGGAIGALDYFDEITQEEYNKAIAEM